MFPKVYLAALVAAAATKTAAAASLKDIKHIVLFMQENRAFDHYYGTMSGVRGFADPNAQVNDGVSVLKQSTPTQNGVDSLTPWHFTYLGGHWVESLQCVSAGSQSWEPVHAAYADGQNNNWTLAESPNSLAYFNRQDLPTHFDIVEGWTIVDMNHQPIMSATDPNRIYWSSGTVNAPGSPSNPDGKGAIILDNTATPGCEAPNLDCFPFTWKTFPEYLEEAGISWQFWQDLDNFEDNMLAYFKQYQDAPAGSPLRTKGNSYPGLDEFYARAANGTLPQVSWIIGPQELTEHVPNRPVDGGWFQKQIVDALTSSPAYNETVLIISYDEQGGWADHVTPIVAPKDTPGEWIIDPWGDGEDVPIGPGPRVPRYIISPYTRGGNVFTEMADHSSDIMFVEAWAAANGYENVYSKELNPWRRHVMSDLTNAFAWDHPDYSIPFITDVATPETKNVTPCTDQTLGCLDGPWVGPARCLEDYLNIGPPVPYGEENANQNLTLIVEEGFKPVRGQLTEGRFLTFEMDGLALANPDGKRVGVTKASSKHEDIRQRWYIETVGGPGASDRFNVRSAFDGNYIANEWSLGSLTKHAKDAGAFTFKYSASGSTYSVGVDHGEVSGFSFLSSAKCHQDWKNHGDCNGPTLGAINIFSVSYH